MKTIVPSFLLI